MTFQIPGPLSMDTPFGETHFWQWADNTPREKVSLPNYLESLGFVKGVDKLTAEQVRILRSAERHYHYRPRKLP